MNRPLEVCILTCDVVGPIRNGGIGTAYHSLAHALARAGHKVTVLYALGQFCENGRIDDWRAEYARHGMDFVPLPETDVQGHTAMKVATDAYRWLKTRSFDIIHYHEWRGVGAYVAQAKRQGLAFGDTLIVAGAHSPTLWHLEGMREAAGQDELETDFLERQSVAKADVLWSPSRHMLQWLRREGWTLPRRIALKPYILLDLVTAARRRADRAPELVFFGRLETRKGIDLFCDALDRVQRAGLAPARVTFLGKISTVADQPSDAFLRSRAERWSFPWQIVSDLDRDRAMAYLREPNRVAVLPSRIDNLPYTVLECLGSSIPFIAADTGGIPEMIRPADRARVLFSLTPESFADRLAAVIGDGLDPAPLRIGADRIVRGWVAWHEAAAHTARISKPRRRTGRRRPLVTICVTTRNRPAYLREALRSIEAQDYPRLQVVLVDDGSDQAEAIAQLDRLEPVFRKRRWTIVRQPNRYLGAARNHAIVHAKGDYVLFMDDDNLAEPHEVSTFVQAAEASGADILTCFLRVFQSALPRPDGNATRTWPFLGAAIGPGLLRNVFGDANAFMRRSVFDRIGGFTEDVGVGCEDWELFARAVLRGLTLEVVPETLVRYRQSGNGMLHTTSQRVNHLRALRPYLSLLPPALRSMVHLASRPASAATARADAARLDRVRRAVVFGSGEAGRLAITLAKQCGWDIGWIVDNNPGMWNRTAHELPVRAPASLSSGGFDVVMIASLAGKAAIARQLTDMGLEPGGQFVHFLDPIRVGAVTYQLSI